MIRVADSCIRCTACITVCPVPATISRAVPGKVRINSATCIDCKECIPVCPVGALKWAPNLKIVPTPVPEVIPEPEPVLPEVIEEEPPIPPKRGRRKKS